MKAIVSLARPNVYLTRFRMFLTLSRRLSRLTILTDELTNELRETVKTYDRVSVVELGKRNYPKKSVDWLLREVVDEHEETIIHSTFGHLVRFFEMYHSHTPRNFKLVSTQYTANHDWFSSVRFKDYPLSFNYFGQRIKSYWTDRRMADSSDAIFVVCPNHTEGVMKAHQIAEEKVHAVPSEVDVGFYQNLTPQRAASRTLLFVGACFKNKGLEVLFDAMSSVFAAYPDVELHLYGRTVRRQEAWFEQALRKVSQHGSVLMKGDVSPTQLRAAFASADLLASPSRFEGSPRAVREALAGGCPCLLSAIPGHLGLDPDRRFIRFLDGESSSLWSDAIIESLMQADETWLERSSAGVNAMRKYYSLEAVADALFERYESLF